MKINLPWPDKVLSPNARVHWAKLNKARQKAKDYTFWLTKEAMRGEGLAKGSHFKAILITIHPPDKRKRDADNLFASMKAPLDGACMALGMDDYVIRDIHIRFGEVERGGRVELEFI